MSKIENLVDQSKMRKEQAEEHRENARRQTERKNELEAEIQQLSKDRVELENSLKHANDQYREADQVKIEIQKKQARLDELERNRKELESDISRILSSSLDELHLEIQKFQLTKVSSSILVILGVLIIFFGYQGERENELKNLEEELLKIEQDLKGNAAVEQQQLVQIGKLRSEEEQHQKRIKMRDDMLTNLATRYQWPDHDILNADNPLSIFISPNYNFHRLINNFFSHFQVKVRLDSTKSYCWKRLKRPKKKSRPSNSNLRKKKRN